MMPTAIATECAKCASSKRTLLRSADPIKQQRAEDINPELIAHRFCSGTGIMADPFRRGRTTSCSGCHGGQVCIKHGKNWRL